jgi:hypothetical protein
LTKDTFEKVTCQNFTSSAACDLMPLMIVFWSSFYPKIRTVKLKVNSIKRSLATALIGLVSVMVAPCLQAHTPPEPQTADIAPQDLQDWRLAEQTDTTQAYHAYLKAHPSGWFKPVAIVRIERGQPINLSPRPYVDLATPTPEQTSALAAWEEQVWQRARSLGTNVAMRTYLIAAPNGQHRKEAADTYLATLPSLPSGIAPDCTRDELSIQKLVSFDISRAYPTRAIDRSLEDEIIGDIVVDHTGLPLAWLKPIYTQPNYFAETTERFVLRMGFKPLRAGCLQAQPLFPMQIKFALAGGGLPALHLPPPKAVDQGLKLDEKTRLILPPGRALKVSIPHDGQYSVYAVKASADYLPIVSYSFDGVAWNRLLNNSHYIAHGRKSVFLSISSAPRLRVGARGDEAALGPATGPVEITVTRQASRPIKYSHD